MHNPVQILRGTVVLALLLLSSIRTAYSCSMYKITIGGRTMVGNNEDSWRLTSRIWFEAATADRYGVAYVGYSDKHNPDGGVNEYGLAFDAFTMPHRSGLPPRDPAKKDFNYGELRTLLQECKTVEEVYARLSQENLQVLNGSALFNGGMLLFVDRSGKYLVVEADALTLGDDPKFLLANFSYAHTKDLSSVTMARYCRGAAYLKDRIDTSLAFCTALSDTMSVHRKRVGDGTLYTTIYDLQDGLIYAYFFHDYSRVKVFNLADELKQGDHEYAFASLFPGNAGYAQFKAFRTPQNSRWLFALVAGCGLLFLFSGCYFGLSWWRSGAQSTQRNWKLLLGLVALGLSWYAYVLISNPSVYYFPAPYRDDHFALSNLTSYFPFLLLALIVPLLRTNWRLWQQGSWTGFARGLYSLNVLAMVVWLGLFGYWGLYNVFG